MLRGDLPLLVQKTLTTVYLLLQSRALFLANRYIIPTGSNRRKACFVREMYTYIHVQLLHVSRDTI